jgi:predicted phage terminase large subunit-like protein
MSTLMQLQEIEAEYVSAGAGVFHQEWFQHYYVEQAGDERFYVLGDQRVAEADCWKFHTVDLAWTLEEDADYTVISTWAVTPKSHLLLLNVIRGRFEGPEIIPQLKYAHRTWGGHMVVEAAARGLGIVQEARRQGLPIRDVKPDKDKLARALPATARLEHGQVWWPPKATPWFRPLEEELLAFNAGRHDDFVDTFAYAVAEVGRKGPARGIEWV